jgi:hypothetical protein
MVKKLGKQRVKLITRKLATHAAYCSRKIHLLGGYASAAGVTES